MRVPNNTVFSFGRWLTISAAAVVFIAVNVELISAQSGGIQWSEPINLSNTSAGSAHPAILADPYGYVHVFWSEDMNGEPVGPDDLLQRAPNTIVYRRWDGTSWSDPVDILAISGEPIAEYISVDIGPSGRIYATWTGLSNTYYSSALSWEAADVHAWSKPATIAADNARSLRESSVAVTPDGVVHVLYATRGASTGVNHIASDNEGADWDAAVRVSAPLTEIEEGYANIRLVSDREGRLHAAWQSFQEQGYGQGVYYSRSLDGGITWSTPVLSGYRKAGGFTTEYPYVTVGQDADLHMIYVDGATSQGRFYRISRDSGKTWSEPKTVLAELEGINGYVVPVLDGAGQIHLIANMRTREGQMLGIYYARSESDGFSQAMPIAVEQPVVSSAHYSAVAVRLGNEIHIVWSQLRGAEIGYMRGEVRELAAVPALPIPTPALETPSAAEPAVAAVATSASPAPTRSAGGLFEAEPSPASTSTLQSVLIGVLPAVLFVLGAVLWTRARHR